MLIDEDSISGFKHGYPLEFEKQKSVNQKEDFLETKAIQPNDAGVMANELYIQFSYAYNAYISFSLYKIPSLSLLIKHLLY